MNAVLSEENNEHVFTVRDMPHFAPYLQFLVNIIHIHFEHVKLGAPDYGISATMNKDDLDVLYKYLHTLEPGSAVEIRERDARVLYAGFVVVSRLLLCDYGEEICNRLIGHLPPQHRWAKFEQFRNDLLHHNTQMLLDMDTNMSHMIGGLDIVKERPSQVSIA